MTRIGKNLCETLYEKAVEKCTTDDGMTACPTNENNACINAYEKYINATTEIVLNNPNIHPRQLYYCTYENDQFEVKACSMGDALAGPCEGTVGPAFTDCEM